MSSRAYYPLGFVFPVIFLMKVLMQDIWRLQISWGEDLPTELARRLFDWYNGLPALEGIRHSKKLRSKNINAVSEQRL